MSESLTQESLQDAVRDRPLEAIEALPDSPEKERADAHIRLAYSYAHLALRGMTSPETRAS